MKKTDSKNINRVIDANFNRAKEGLRVCEDTCRFVLNQQSSSSKYKRVRHQLTKVIEDLKISEVIKARDIQNDVGKRSTSTELKRQNPSDIFYANSQRVKESIRVLEEFTKIKKIKSAQDLKRLRYCVYGIEKEITSKI